ncbi:MAG TPA: hypothetical protein VKS60_02575 [Stellaceae bacterium]|nr:hypothetical protein [Stellaceae bacterium]
MARTFALSAFLALCLAAPGLAHPPSYVPGTEDVPLMPGLETVDGSALIFDKPQGRIVEVSASGALKRSDVLQFYAASLPALGWTKAGRQAYQREGERLSFEFTGADGHLIVGILLEPEY